MMSRTCYTSILRNRCRSKRIGWGVCLAGTWRGGENWWPVRPWRRSEENKKATFKSLGLFFCRRTFPFACCIGPPVPWPRPCVHIVSAAMCFRRSNIRRDNELGRRNQLQRRENGDEVNGEEGKRATYKTTNEWRGSWRPIDFTNRDGLIVRFYCWIRFPYT